MFLVLLVIYFAWTSFRAFLPASAPDELIYHLEIPKAILSGVWISRDNIYSFFPHLGEYFFVLGMKLGGETGAKLCHVLAGVFLSFALYRVARKCLSVFYANLALILFLSIPTVMVIMPWAYVDLFFSLFTFLALAALIRHFEFGQMRWLVFSGFSAGLAFAAKYTGLFLVLIVLCVLLFEHYRRRSDFKQLAKSIVIFLSLSLVPVMPFLIRNYVVTGWPFFPFHFPFFALKPGINWDAERARLYVGWAATYGTEIGKPAMWRVLLSPMLVFLSGKFEAPEWYDGVVGPVFLLTPLVLLLDKSKKPIAIKVMSDFSLLYLFVWMFQMRQVRLLLPAMPVICILLSYGMSRLRARIRYGVLCFVGTMAVLSLASGVREVLLGGPMAFWTGRESRHQYLARQIQNYPAYEMTNRLLTERDRVYLVDMQNYVYWLRPKWRADFVFEHYRIERLITQSPDAKTLADFFIEQDVSHLLINRSFVSSEKWGMDGGKMAVFQEFLDIYAKPVASFRQYWLYRLMR